MFLTHRKVHNIIYIKNLVLIPILFTWYFYRNISYHCFYFTRIDAQYSFGTLDKAQILDMFCNFFPSADPDEVTQLTKILDNCSSEIGGADDLQSSEFQRHFLRYSKSSKDALMNLHLVRDYLLMEAKDDPSSIEKACSEKDLQE